MHMPLRSEIRYSPKTKDKSVVQTEPISASHKEITRSGKKSQESVSVCLLYCAQTIRLSLMDDVK